MSTEQAVRTALESLGIYERIEKVENRQTFIAKRLHTEDVLVEMNMKLEKRIEK